MENRYVGISFLSVLQVVFIAFKIAKVIDWSWWVVFLPLWIDLGIGLIALIIMLIILHDPKGPRGPWNHYKY